MFRKNVRITQKELIRHIARAYRDGWKDATIDMPFFNGYYVDKELVGALYGRGILVSGLDDKAIAEEFDRRVLIDEKLDKLEKRLEESLEEIMDSLRREKQEGEET